MKSKATTSQISKEQILKIAGDFTVGILGENTNTNMCFIACSSLQGYLRAICGVDYELVDGFLVKGDIKYHHCWLENLDGSILDPTASQFNHLFSDMPDIYMGKKPKWYEKNKCLKYQ